MTFVPVSCVLSLVYRYQVSFKQRRKIILAPPMQAQPRMLPGPDLRRWTFYFHIVGGNMHSILNCICETMQWNHANLTWWDYNMFSCLLRWHKMHYISDEKEIKWNSRLNNCSECPADLSQCFSWSVMTQWSECHICGWQVTISVFFSCLKTSSDTHHGFPRRFNWKQFNFICIALFTIRRALVYDPLRASLGWQWQGKTHRKKPWAEPDFRGGAYLLLAGTGRI